MRKFGCMPATAMKPAQSLNTTPTAIMMPTRIRLLMFLKPVCCSVATVLFSAMMDYPFCASFCAHPLPHPQGKENMASRGTIASVYNEPHTALAHYKQKSLPLFLRTDSICGATLIAFSPPFLSSTALLMAKRRPLCEMLSHSRPLTQAYVSDTRL